MGLEHFSTLQLVLLAILPVLSAIILHEIAHGWTARYLGDDTAARMGRLSLNPLKHIDPIGTILVPILMLVLADFAFGWAKPVPIDWTKLRHPRRDMVLVALAGPGSNLVMLLAWVLIAKIALGILPTPAGLAEIIWGMCLFGIVINTILMVFNLLPLPPLDGGRVAVGLLPLPIARALSRIEPFSFFIIVALLASGYLGQWLTPVITTVLMWVHQLLT